MLEDQVAYLLQRYLGNYVRGLNKDALKISVWQGDVELSNMQLKPEALNALKLPVRVKAGFLGSVKLKVPWSRLGQEPVIIYLDQILILAEPTTQVEGCSEDMVQEIKRSRVRDMEMKQIENQQQLKSKMNSSWIGSFINTIIGNLKLSISNVHIRYEDLESNPGHAFAAGLTLQKLSAVTVDDSGMETFATGGALERIQKSVELESLAFYFDSDVCLWNSEKLWEDLSPLEWIQIFEVGREDGKTKKVTQSNHTYVLQPVSGNARYTKLNADETRDTGEAIQKAIVNLDDVTLRLSKDGYRDILKLADNFNAFNQRLKYVHFRPTVSIGTDPRLWWKYGYRAVVDEMKKASGKFSWEHVLKYARLRKRYVTLYASLLKSDLNQTVADDNEGIKAMDRELDIEVILQWRMLAHKFLEQSVESGLQLNKQKAKSSWWPFGSTSGSDESENKGFTEDDWEQLNRLIGYREDAEESISRGRVDQLLSFLEVHMKYSASKLVTDCNNCLADLSCDGMDFSLKMYRDTIIFDLKLGSYRLLCPKGLLAESETVSDSLVGVFSYKPFDTELDWSFIAKASPCYVTYLKDSVDEIISFFRRGTAISQTIALETVTAVQVTLDEVRRTAHQQVTRALKDHARFSLDLDIAAPKITIPTKFSPENFEETKLLLDFGHLILSTQDFWELGTPKEKDIYSQFNVILRDVSAFLVDGDHSWNHTAPFCSRSSELANNSFLPVIEKCMVVLSLQQVLVEDPLYPSLRISMRLPSLGFCFSPARYHRLMQVAKIFQEDGLEDVEIICPWRNADIEGWISLLSWKGMASREAIWQTRYLSLVGPFLYVLENPASKTYKHYISLRGKQVHQVPVEFTGEEHVLAVFDSTRSIMKVMEDANALIIQFDSDDLRKAWEARLRGAIYRASGSAAVTSLVEISQSQRMTETSRNMVPSYWNEEKLFVTGVLDELKVCFTCSYNHEQSLKEIILARENRLFEFRASGGQVELSIKGNDLFVGTILRSLEIEDQFMREKDSRPRYLARSFIWTEKDTTMTALSSSTNGIQNIDNQTPGEMDIEEQFYEASDSLGDFADYDVQSQEDTSDLGMKNHAVFAKLSVKPPHFCRLLGLLPDVKRQIENEELEMADTLKSFVKVQIVCFHQDSPLYNNVDMKISVTLATLSFFCHRPTILAILQSVSAINAVDGDGFQKDSTSATQESALMTNTADNMNSDISREPAVKALLGKGKSRVLFYLRLNMARAHIFLVIEDGSRLATLLQNNLLSEIKVFPSSFSMKAALGNLKISDDSLPSSHAYFWMCDMRDPSGTSFVELDFMSFSVEDDDYCGYDYSLIGRFSEVRIIYLNRFIQEVAGYFAGLVTSGSQGVVKLKDQAASVERAFSVVEIEGSPALKLDISFNKPIIIMPQRTDSPDYLELDVLHITVANTFQWIGGKKNVINAVHLETLTVQVKEINLTVGTGETSGENIIEDVTGLSIIIHRSLQDLLHNIPLTEAVIKVKELRAALSNREYQVITECAVSNISEAPRVLPNIDFGFIAAGGETPLNGHYRADVTEVESQHDLGWISIKVSVAVDLMELHLHSGRARDVPLATIQAIGAWLLYKTNSFGESFLWATLKGFNVIDDRDGTKDEFRHAIAMHENISFMPSHYELIDGEQGSNVSSTKKHLPLDQASRTVATMLILDVIFKKASTNLSLCVQRPHLLVALDFLLAIGEFFVPSLRTLLSDETDEDSLHLYSAAFLDNPIYYQPSSEFSLSPKNPLVLDDERFDHYIYDGKGGTLCLKDSNGNGISCISSEVIFFVGSGKRLRFKNVVIKNGVFLDSCIFLGSNSSYSALEDDNVFLEREAECFETMNEQSQEARSLKHLVDKPSEMQYLIELQAIGPEFTFYNNSKDVGESLLLSSKHFHAELDLFCRLAVKGDSIEIGGDMLGLKVESNGIRVLEPFDTSVKFFSVSGRKNISISVSDIFMNFSYNLMMLFLAVEEDILTFLRMTSKKASITCSQFDYIGAIFDDNGRQKCAFWRPRAPPGFAVLGDCVTPWNEPPSKGVLAVNTSFIRVKRPVSYRLIWPPLDSDDAHNEKDIHQGRDALESVSTYVSGGTDGSCSIWFPIAPQGYVALGCVVSAGRVEPPLSSSLCIRACLVSPCPMRDCISVHINQRFSSDLAFWRVANAFGSFFATNSNSIQLNSKALELRHLLPGAPGSYGKLSAKSDIRNMPHRHNQADQLQRSPPLSSGRLFEAVASFKLIWWNQGAPDQRKLSIWRPIIPEGMFYFGDVAVHGYEPPNACFVLRDTRDDHLVKPPLDFQLVGQIRRCKRLESVSLWLPQAPPGYVSLGCIASRSSPKRADFGSLRCIRSDMVVSDEFPEESIWDSSKNRMSREPFSIWSVGNEVGTFIVRRGSRRPPKRFALRLADLNVSSNLDSIVIDAQIRTLSAAVYDDYGNLMVPLFNVSLSGIGFNMHGRSDFTSLTTSFTLSGRSYNDERDAWEPLLEPLDGFLRYQYDSNAPGAVSQLRVASTGDLNLNISASNINMMLQAYSSWNSLSQVHALYRNRELASPCYSGQSIIDVHQKRDYYIIPQNKLGLDIYMRATEMRRYSSIIQMPSGDNKPIKVPVSKNLPDSHLNARDNRVARSMVIVIIYSAELPEMENLGGGQYTTAIHLVPNTDSTVIQLQSARTCGAVPEISSTSGLPSVNWNEMFFFRADCLDNYTVDFIVTDMGTGKPFGIYSSALENIASKQYPNSDLDDLYSKWTWRELSSANSMLNAGDMEVETCGRIKFAVIFRARPASKQDNKSIHSNRSRFLQISPTMEGPWTTVRLNYTAPAACWRLGNNVVASELTVKNGTRYVNIRSLVSLTNNTEFVINLCLKSKSSKDKILVANPNDHEEGACTSFYEADVFFETEKYIPLVGWVNDSFNMPSSLNIEIQPPLQSGPKEIPNLRLPPGWEWIDDWHVDSSTVKDSDGWVYASDIKNLRWPESFRSTTTACNARQRKWIRHRKYICVGQNNQVPLNVLKPGETIPLPLQAVVHPVLSFFLQLQPIHADDHHEYSWSEVRVKNSKDGALDDTHGSSELCVSTLAESEILLYCAEANGSPSTITGGIWFCLSIQPTEIGKDVHLDPIYDWKIVVNCPLSITNYLPLPAEYSLLKMIPRSQFVTCSQERFLPGETVKIYSVNLQDPLYITLNLRGWEPIHDPILISHPSKLPSRTANLRSSFSGRVVQIIFEQNHDNDYLMARHIRVYVPYWICCSGCPPLVYKFLDMSEWKGRKHLASEVSFKGEEKVIWEIIEEEMFEGCTIASAINFKNIGLSMSISGDGMAHFGPIKDMSPLGDMDGFLDICAYEVNGNCFQIFITSKSCPYTDAPTKVVNLQPFMTFTNRTGQNVYLKFTETDQPKTLHPYDSRVSFVYSEAKVSYKLQVQLEGTAWSHPIEISKEDSFIIMLRKHNGHRSFLRVEIRGYEEGSRFLLVFRLDTSNGLIRLENRVPGKTIGFRQSGLIDDDAWIQLESFSTTNFSWENPYGHRCLDFCIQDEINNVIQLVSLDETAESESSRALRAHGIEIHILYIADIKIVRFTNMQKLLELCLNDGPDSLPLNHGGSSSMQDESQNENTPMELIIELGIVGVSLIDHKPQECLFFYLERVFVSYSTGYDAGTTDRFKLILGQVQVDNQLPLTVMPVLLAAENSPDASHPAFKTTITMKNTSSEDTQVYPYVYVRVADTCWKLNIHEPIIWALVDFYNKIHLDHLYSDLDVMQVDPEIRIDLIDVSEIRLKLSVETSPTQRPHGVLGIWSPILSAVGNALKIQVHLRKVMHRNRFMRKSAIIPSIFNRIRRDLIHDPLHLIFSVDVLGMTKSTFASLSKGFAELSTDGQFLQLRSKQVWSRRITGVSDGILQGTEALAQGVTFGVSGVVKKPIESARQNGLLGFAQGLGQAFLGFIVQPVSGALDFVSLTVDGISASFARCLEIVSNKTTVQRIRNPRAIHADGVIREYSKKEATGQMILYLAEASRHLGCTDLFKEPSKYAWSDYYEDHFIIPHHRIVLITNKRVMLLQCLALDKMDKQPSKIIWDVQWEDVLSLELAKAGYSKPSHLIIHVRNFHKSESFVKLIKCHTTEDDFEEPQAVTICSAVRRIWKAHLSVMKTLSLKVPSGQGHVQFAIEEADEADSKWTKPFLKPREIISAHVDLDNRRFVRHTGDFQMIWTSKQETRSHCTLCPKQVEDDKRCSIWRPSCPNGYVSLGDVARMGIHPPHVVAVYKYSDKVFASPVGYDLVWRNCLDDYDAPVTIWHPRAPEGFVTTGCIAVASFEEPHRTAAFCVAARIAEETTFEDQTIWTVPDSYPWSCYLYQVQSGALHFVALRQPKEQSDWKPTRISQQHSGHSPEVGESEDDGNEALQQQQQQ